MTPFHPYLIHGNHDRFFFKELMFKGDTLPTMRENPLKPLYDNITFFRQRH